MASKITASILILALLLGSFVLDAAPRKICPAYTAPDSRCTSIQACVNQCFSKGWIVGFCMRADATCYCSNCTQ